MAKRPTAKYDFKAFGQAIKVARIERKESRKKVSDEMYISPRYLANIENKGIEFEIKANIIDNKDWNWFVGFNIGKNKNKITDIDAEYVGKYSDSGRQELGFDLRV